MISSSFVSIKCSTLAYLLSVFDIYGCQTAFLKVIEGWIYNVFIAAILMDLSKAFDCLPHDLLLPKLNIMVPQNQL